MDNFKDSAGNLALWLPGSAIVLSLGVSTFALTREPFLEPRPIGAQFQAQLPIEARLWQDPFDALARYRKKLKDGKGEETDSECTRMLFDKPIIPGNPIDAAQARLLLASNDYEVSKSDGGNSLTSAAGDSSAQEEPPALMVALVEGGPYADEVELRRRIRYAILAGLKNAHMVPEDEQHIRCLALPGELLTQPGMKKSGQEATHLQRNARRLEIPYEAFVADPFDPPTDRYGNKHASARTILFWVKQEYLGSTPLERLDNLRKILFCTVAPHTCEKQADNRVLKIIGPATSSVLRDMYRQEAEGKAVANIEIYSPLATAERDMLLHGIDNSSKTDTPPQEPTESTNSKVPMKLLRTVSDDGTMTRLLLEELKLRRVDPAGGIQCIPPANDEACARKLRRSQRVALISEWDSTYSRALIESFKSKVAENAFPNHPPSDREKALVNEWVLRFSYLRGLDGRLPEEVASSDKTTGKDASKDDNPLDISPLEKSDGNAQLDYLRRLADHILSQDEAYRRKGDSGIGAIGVLGSDAYDKLLVLQALKRRMPNKVFFSTDLDARMLQRGQVETTRNLVLAAPYGLTLTRALQQDVPPFRDSLQSAVFVAVLAAQAPQNYDAKRAKFDYSTGRLLSPGIYEVGISGFIPLASRDTASRADNCAAPDRSGSDSMRPDLMALRCLQDPPPPPYPEPSDFVRKQLGERLSFFWAGPLTLIVLGGAIFLGWWWTDAQATDSLLPTWVRGLPLALYVASGLSAWIATLLWRVGFMWLAFVLILLGIISSELVRCTQRPSSLPEETPARVNTGLFDSSAWYIAVPIAVFFLALMCAYQFRHTLTDNGLGEPMFLFEGISAWPTIALRLLAILISISSLAWGWRCLRLNRNEIEASYQLTSIDAKESLWQQFPPFPRPVEKQAFTDWLRALGRYLFSVLFPLSPARLAEVKVADPAGMPSAYEGRTIDFDRFWSEHCLCGSFGARMLRAILATWVFMVATSALYVLWPFQGAPIRGESPIWMLGWLATNIAFYLLVFWVVDANRLLARFIRQLSNHHAIWPKSLQDKHQKIFGIATHPCIDDWVDMMLIAKRSSAVNRLIYAPTVVMLILVASRSSLFDNWPTPPSLVISFLLTTLILLFSALSLRRAAEKARGAALRHIDDYLLNTTIEEPYCTKFRMMRERVAMLNTGAFSRYSDEPLVRALLLSLTGIGGSAIVDALNFAKF